MTLINIKILKVQFDFNKCEIFSKLYWSYTIINYALKCENELTISADVTLFSSHDVTYLPDVKRFLHSNKELVL